MYIEDVEKLLNDDEFVIWCFDPKSVDNPWWFEWMKSSSDKAIAVDKARSIVLSLKINNYSLTKEEIADMKTHLRKRLKKKRVLFQYYSLAAVLLVLVSISLCFFNQTEDDNRIITNNLKTIDNSQTEIELFVQNKEKYQLPNETQIKLQSDGKIELEDKVVELIETQKNVSTSDVNEEFSFNTLKVPYGRRSSLTFSDGTKAWINSGTILVFPAIFNDKERVIEVSGEIYLEVSEDKTRPFIVKTSQMDVSVLGTSFNVSAYPEDKEQAVVLVTGKVLVDCNNRTFSQILHPKERIVLSDNEIVVDQINVENYISWKDGLLRFENKRLEQVLDKLTRYYRLNFQYDPVVGEFVCSGKLVLFDDVNQVINTLEKSFPITCEIEGDQIKITKKNKNNMPM